MTCEKEKINVNTPKSSFMTEEELEKHHKMMSAMADEALRCMHRRLEIEEDMEIDPDAYHAMRKKKR